MWGKDVIVSFRMFFTLEIVKSIFDVKIMTTEEAVMKGKLYIVSI